MSDSEDDFEVACFLAKAGLPLDTKVETKTFSHVYSKHWFKMLKHHEDWLMALLEYGEQEPTRRGWRKMQGLYRKFLRSANDFFIYTDSTGAASKDEKVIAGHFCRERFMPVVKRWNEISDALKNDQPVYLNIKELFIADQPTAGTMQ